eukprot:COSAG02_NODE_1327_length_13220_cov_11.602241_15_plen_178_part_01
MILNARYRLRNASILTPVPVRTLRVQVQSTLYSLRLQQWNSAEKWDHHHRSAVRVPVQLYTVGLRVLVHVLYRISTRSSSVPVPMYRTVRVQYTKVPIAIQYVLTIPLDHCSRYNLYRDFRANFTVTLCCEVNSGRKWEFQYQRGIFSARTESALHNLCISFTLRVTLELRKRTTNSY